MNLKLDKKPNNFYKENAYKCNKMMHCLLGVTKKEKKSTFITTNKYGTEKKTNNYLSEYWDQFDSFPNLYNEQVLKQTLENTGEVTDKNDDLNDKDLKLFYHSSKAAIRGVFESDIGEEFYNSFQEMNKDEFQQAQERLVDLLVSNQRGVTTKDRFNPRIVGKKNSSHNKTIVGGTVYCAAASAYFATTGAAVAATGGLAIPVAMISTAAIYGGVSVAETCNSLKYKIDKRTVTKINPDKLVNLESAGLSARHENVLTKYEGRPYTELVFDVTTGKEPSKYKEEMQNKEQDQTSVTSSLDGKSIESKKFEKQVQPGGAQQRGGDGDHTQTPQSKNFLDAIKKASESKNPAEHEMC